MTGISIVIAFITILANAVFINIIKSKEYDIKKLLLPSSFIVTLLIIIGLIIDFLFNINPLENLFVPFLAELAGILVGFILGFMIFDKYKDQLQERLWEQLWSGTRKSAYESTLTDLIMVAIGVYSCLPGASWTEVPGDFSRTKEANGDIWEKINNELSIFPELSNKLIGYEDRESIIKDETDGKWIEVDSRQSVAGLVIKEENIIWLINQSYEIIKPYLDEIKNIQILRIMQSSKDEEIRKGLVDFEQCVNNYYYNMQRFSVDHLGGHSHGIFVIRSMIKLCENASNLYKRLDERS